MKVMLTISEYNPVVPQKGGYGKTRGQEREGKTYV